MNDNAGNGECEIQVNTTNYIRIIHFYFLEKKEGFEPEYCFGLQVNGYWYVQWVTDIY
jgi:hypothetical protein